MCSARFLGLLINGVRACQEMSNLEQLLMQSWNILSHTQQREHITLLVKYLSEQLNTKVMHEQFMEKCPQRREVKYSFYYKIFKPQFSLTFGRPQVDSCCSCEELSMKLNSKPSNDTAKRVAAAQLIIH
jgi:hypothetical protein